MISVGVTEFETYIYGKTKEERGNEVVVNYNTLLYLPMNVFMEIGDREIL
jgi:hypothetical protein